MRSWSAARVLALGVSLAAARCGSCKSKAPAPADAAPPAPSAASNVPPAPLSLPMAADHDRNGDVYVAGFVAAREVIDLSRYDAQGRLAWNGDALTNVAYSADAHVDVVATPDGAVVVWRGLHGGKRGRVAGFVAADGKVGATFAVGSNACAAAGTLLSITSKNTLTSRRLPAGPDKKIASFAEGRDAVLVCGEGKRAFLVDEGEDDIGVRPIDDGVARPRALLVAPDDLGDDEIREHDDFTIGDVLGQLLLTEAGHLVLREYVDGPTARRPLEAVIGPDSDLMATDGNAARVVAVVSRDASARCDGEIGTDVVAIDVPLPDGNDRTVDVAHADCGHDLGPYWVAPTDAAMYVAWAVRGPRSGEHAPVEALAWAKVDGGSGAPNQVKLSAEDVVFAGCTKDKCMFAALERPEGTDGMAPGAARIIALP